MNTPWLLAAFERPLRAAGRIVARAAAAALIGMVIIYKLTLSPLLGRHCRFQPTCSTYFRKAVEAYGPFRGGWLGLKRICRCHPWNPGGYDPP